MISPLAYWTSPLEIAPTPPAYGPEWLFLLHFDGANGASTSVDSSSYNRTLTPMNGAILTSTYSKFGGSSTDLYGAANTKGWTLGTASDWNLGTGSFTMDIWAMARSVPVGTGELITLAINDNSRWNLVISGGNLYLQSYLSTDSSFRMDISATMSWVANQWKHIAVTRNSNTGTSADWCFFEDGVKKTIFLGPGSYANKMYWEPGAYMDIGQTNRTGYLVSNGFYLDEARLLKGVAAWTASFTPPAAPY